jgi:hypothetical protein
MKSTCHQSSGWSLLLYQGFISGCYCFGRLGIQWQPWGVSAFTVGSSMHSLYSSYFKDSILGLSGQVQGWLRMGSWMTPIGWVLFVAGCLLWLGCPLAGDSMSSVPPLYPPQWVHHLLLLWTLSLSFS